MESSAHRLEPVAVEWVDDGAHVTDEFFVGLGEMELLESAETVFVAQHACYVESGAMLWHTELMGREDTTLEVVAKGIEALLYDAPCASAVVAWQG